MSLPTEQPDSETVATQIDRIQKAIAALQAQRNVLGDEVVNAALMPLREQVSALQSQASPVPSPHEERRIITILFSDVVGSVSLAEQLDPEDWRQAIAAVQSTIGEIVVQNDGMIAQYQGDALIAFWGAQATSEYDAENAIRAGLAAQAALASLPGPVSVQIRVGIHTGLVVLGEWGADAKIEFGAFGDAVNVAARLMSTASPGTVVISHDTYRYVRGVFDLTPRPPLSLKGKSEPVRTYLVRRAKPRPFRVVTRGVAGVETRTVGRAAEFKAIQGAYQDAYENRCVVWTQLVGEPGIGKSRLVADTNNWIDLRDETVFLLRARTFPGDLTQPYALVRRLWFDRFQIAEDALLAEAETKWVERFLELAQAKEDDPSLGVEAAHALGLMLGLPFRASPFIGALRQDPSQVKGRGFAISRALLSRMRETSPTVMLVEDLHWADASSWHWLVETVFGAPELPQGLFVLATARPEWSPPPELRTSRTNGKERYVEIPLGPLADETVRELTGDLLQRVEPMPDGILNSVVERAEGNPYYAEEMVNYFLDRGIIDPNGEPWRFVQARWQGSPLPTTLQQLLLTRLTALTEPERTALQRGAIFGRSFWTGGLEAMGVCDSIRLLDGLLPRGLVEPQPESVFEAEREWAFHHALLHEVTYESVLKRERAALHRQAAQWLEQQAGRAGRLDEFAGTIAEHWDRAGEQNAAIDWYLRAGESAVASFALAEGRRFFDRVLQLLAPDDNERRWCALSGREFILDALAQRELQKADIDALLELANTFSDDLRCAHAYHRKAWYHATMADARSAIAAVDQVSAAAQRARQRHAKLASVPGELRALGLKTGALSRLGEMSAARQTAEEILARANSEESGAVLAGALNFVAIHFQEANDPARSTKVMLQVIQMARNCGDRFNEAMAAGNLGFNYILFGMYKQARATLEQALALHAAIGNHRLRAYSLQNLGLALCLSGDGLLARQVEEQALSEATAQGDRFLKASCRNYLGLIIEQAGDPAGAARLFAQAQVELTEINYRTHALDPTAGLARCAFAQGLLEEAQQHTAQVWRHLSEHGTTGMEFPTHAYLTVVDIMDGLRDQETARLALEQGYRDLMERAGKISEPEWRKSFLENVEAHRVITERWQRLKG